jgi:pyruvate decarboxylase
MVCQEVSSERLHIPLLPTTPPNDPVEEKFVLDRIYDRVKEAEGDVVILVDACVIRHGVKKEVVELLQETCFPVYATPMGKTAVDESWKRYGGVSPLFGPLSILASENLQDLHRFDYET